MSRFNEYEGDDVDWALQMGRWEHNLRATMRGKKGQKVLAELEAALLAMPEHRLIEGDVIRPVTRVNDEGALEDHYEACVIGAFALYKGLRPDEVWKYETGTDTAELGQRLGMTYTMAWTIGDENDYNTHFTPEARWQHMLDWVRSKRIGV